MCILSALSRRIVLVVGLAVSGGCVDLGRPEFHCARGCDGGASVGVDGERAPEDLGASPDGGASVDGAGVADGALAGPEVARAEPDALAAGDGPVREDAGPAVDVAFAPDAAPAAADGGAEAGPASDAAVVADAAPAADVAAPPVDVAAPPVDVAAPGPDLPLPDSSATCTSSLLGRWRLDDGSGVSARDESCHANHAAAVNAQAGDWQAGRLGGALAIVPARAVYLRVANSGSLNPTGALSLAIWIHSSSWNAGRRHLFQKGALDNQFRVWSESNALWFNVAGLSPPSIYMDLPSNGTWHHVAAVYDGGNLRFYLDGTQVKSTAVTGASQVTADDLFIGTESASSSGGDFFNGLIDEVLFYGRALTAAEVGQLAAGGAPPP